MKLSDLRPCDGCGGSVAPVFYILRVSLAAINTTAANQTLGLRQMFGGNMALAEAFSPSEPVMQVEGDTEIRLCIQCYCGEQCVGALVEQRNIAREEPPR